MESLIAEKQSALLQVDPETGLLVFRESPYELSMEMIYREFVATAPFRADRELLFDAASIYLR